MAEIEIKEILSYLVPLLVAYNIWLHKMVIKAQLDIAVNFAKDSYIIERIDKLEEKLDRLIQMEIERK